MGTVGPTPKGVSTVHSAGKVCGLQQRKGQLISGGLPQPLRGVEEEESKGSPRGLPGGQPVGKDCRRGPEPSLPGAGRRNVNSRRAVPRTSKDIRIGSH